ncbi:MAG: CBS domain-containing protein, partial [Anaerolineae bacterium]|nr:CBS domain-containing protein [Anaerolineae bacterium]
SKVFNDDWMRENGFLQSPWFGGQVANLMDTRPAANVLTAQVSDRITDVIDVLKQHNISQLPVMRDGSLVGLISERDLLNHMLFARHQHTPDETIEALVSTDITVVGPDTPLDVLGEAVSQGQVAVVLENGAVTGIITKIDLIDYLAGQIR